MSGVTLTENALDLAFKCIETQGYGFFFPHPVEWELVKANWPALRSQIQKYDLDTYKPYPPLDVLVPKSRLAIRRASLLHPQDLLIYTALALQLKQSIQSARLAPNRQRVFSYRTEKTEDHELYQANSGYPRYQARLRKKLVSAGVRYAGVTDIADYFPRIYQHRLINALQAASGNVGPIRDTIRVLEKFLTNLTVVSYGLPVGPFASRLFAEAVLIDVDNLLLADGIDFIRFVDDYVVFGKQSGDVEWALYRLGEHLYDLHGLTLQSAKTRILRAETYYEELQDRLEEGNADRALMRMLARETGYGGAMPGRSDHDRAWVRGDHVGWANEARTKSSQRPVLS